jgi:hypothetical protein
MSGRAFPTYPSLKPAPGVRRWSHGLRLPFVHCSVELVVPFCAGPTLLRAPEYFSPYKHPEKALQRRNQVLEAMAAQGKLSATEAASAETTPIAPTL